MTRFDDKLVLVTGATSGIGRAGALRLAREGARLILTGRRPERLDALRDELPDAMVLADDAADPDTGSRLAEAVTDAGGSLHGLWLNAGYASVGPVEDVTPEVFDSMMAANVRGPALQLAALAPHLADGASVLTTSSTATYEGGAIASIYAATKGAQVAMVRSWASALGERGIRANTLVPGPIETDFRHFMGEEERADFESDVTSRTALGRAGDADEVASVALFLLSDESSFVTGAQYSVDGGLTKV